MKTRSRAIIAPRSINWPTRCPFVVIAGLHETPGVAMILNVPHDRENHLSLDTQLLQSFQIGNQVGIAGHRMPEFKIQC